MESTNTTEEKKLQIIEKVPTKELQIPLDLYARSSSMEAYVKIIFLVIGALVIIHNVFLAGRSFDYSTYESIKTIELSIVGIILLIVFTLAGIAVNLNLKVNKNLKEISKQYDIETKIIQDEFSALAIHLYGGRGVQLKKK